MLVWLIVPFMIFAVFDPSPLKFLKHNICCFIARFKLAILSFCTANVFENEHETSSAKISQSATTGAGPIFEWSRGSNCVSVPNFVAIGPTVAEIWRYFDFSRRRTTLSWIFKFLKLLTAGRLKMVMVPWHC